MITRKSNFFKHGVSMASMKFQMLLGSFNGFWEVSMASEKFLNGLLQVSDADFDWVESYSKLHYKIQ